MAADPNEFPTRRRAAQYVRMSTEHQRYSIANQSAAIAVWCAFRGFDIVRTYTDAGKSGLRLDGRDGLKALLADVVSGSAEYEAIVTYDVSRWGRFQDPDQAAHYEFICREAGVRVHYCAEQFENDLSLASSILKHMKRMMAGEYSRELSERIRRAKRRLAGLGFKQGSATTFGIARMLIDASGVPRQVLKPNERKAINDDKIVFVRGAPHEVAVVRTIFRLFCRERYSRSAIARYLRERGVLRHGGKAWSADRVGRILTNPIYAGWYVYGKTRTELDGTRVAFPEESWVRTRVLKPIVSEAVFARAQLMRGQRRYRPMSGVEMLRRLKRLLEEEGRVTNGLIERTRYTPGGRAYQREFGSLANAYQLIGWRTPLADRKRPASSFTNEEIIAALVRLYERHGFLTTRIVEADPESPTREVLVSRFGSTTTAYHAAGYDTNDRAQRALGQALRRSRYYETYLDPETEPPKEWLSSLPTPLPLIDRCPLSDLAEAIRRRDAAAPNARARPGGPCHALYQSRLGCLPTAYNAAGPASTGVRFAYHFRKPPDDLMLGRLRAIYREHGRVSTELLREDPFSPSPRTYAKRFGSLMAAYEAAGLSTISPTPKSDYFRDYEPDDVLLEHLRAVQKEHGKLTVALMAERPACPSAHVFRRRFGSIKAACKAAGIKYGPLSKAEFVKRLRAVREKHGRVNSTLINWDRDCPSVGSYRAKFGTLSKAYAAAGIEGPGISKAELIERLRAVQKKYGRVSRDLINRDPDCPSVMPFVCRFGSMTKAYEAAGIPFKRG